MIQDAIPAVDNLPFSGYNASSPNRPRGASLGAINDLKNNDSPGIQGTPTYLDL